MYHVRVLVLFVYGWISKSVCQMAPFGIESLLFGGLGGLPPSQPMGIPFGLGGLYGQSQFAPSIVGMPPSLGGYSMGPLPFPLFPMPCDVVCDHGGLFFANINIAQPQQQQQQRPGMPSGGGMPTGGGMPSGAGMPGMPPGGMPGARPPTGALPGGGMPSTPRPGAGATPPTRPPTPTTMPPRPPMPMAQQQPNINAQILYFVPNWAPYPSMSWPPYTMPFYG